jgi:hypothetical protein
MRAIGTVRQSSTSGSAAASKAGQRQTEVPCGAPWAGSPRCGSAVPLRGQWRGLGEDRLLPNRAQLVEVDDCIERQRDPRPTEAQQQLDVDHRSLEHSSRKVEVYLSELRVDLEDSGDAPHTAPPDPATHGDDSNQAAFILGRQEVQGRQSARCRAEPTVRKARPGSDMAASPRHS